MHIPHLILSSIYKHHNKNGGYTRLADYTKPLTSILIKDKPKEESTLFDQYRFLNELKLLRYTHQKPKLIHLYFAEEYLRFSPYLMRNIPVVGTFHQPPELLEREVLHGDFQGRVYGLAHQLSRKRFQRLAAAIILDENQRPIMESVMPKEKIHLIPHGIDPLGNTQEVLVSENKENRIILTVGNWQRNWEQYEQILQYFDGNGEDLIFRLVSKNTSQDIIERFKRYSCFQYKRNVSGEELEQLYRSALILMLPLKAGTANNALLEGLNYGLPVLISDVFDNPLYRNSAGLELIEDSTTFIKKIKEFYHLDTDTQQEKRIAAKQLGEQFTWPRIAERMLALYGSIIQST